MIFRWLLAGGLLLVGTVVLLTLPFVGGARGEPSDAVSLPVRGTQGAQTVRDTSQPIAGIEAARARIAALVRSEARRQGVPVRLALAVVRIESNFNPRARGGVGEIGLMQIRPRTARGLGYRGSIRALYRPETNLKWGMRYLAGAYELAGGTTCGTILRYNAGHGAKRMNPISARYCRRALAILGEGA